MINIFLLSFIATLLFSPIGAILKKRKIYHLINAQYFSEVLIYGLILVSFISLILNFFTPLTKTINTTILVLSLFILYRHRKIFFNLKYLSFLVLTSFIVYFLIVKSNTFRPDAGLYHLPYISILNNEKIIFGLSNFHYRFGHVSIIQYTSAFFNNHLFSSNGIVLPAALIYASIVINFVSQIKIYLEKKDYNFHLFFLVSIIIYILGKMHRYSEFGNDTPTHLLFLFLLSEILKNDCNHRLSEIRNFLLLGVFIFLNKIFFILSVVFPLIFLSKKNYKKLILNGKCFFIFIFFLIWITKNIVVSGCALYPIKQTCLNNFSWTDTNKAQIVSNENEAWAKSWPGYIKTDGEISHINYNKNFKWLKTWIKFNGYKSFKVVISYILIITIIGLFFYKKNKNPKNLKKSHLKNLKFIISILMIGIILWFLKAPDYRYGTGYILGLLSITFSFIISNNFKKKLSNKIYIILFLSFFVFISKNFTRIIIVDKNYFNSPWPKYYSHSEDNIYKKPKKIKINYKNLYTTNGLCMYGLAPCSRTRGNFKIIKKFSYDFFVIR